MGPPRPLSGEALKVKAAGHGGFQREVGQVALSREERALRILLIDVARRRTTTTYSEVASALRSFTSIRLEKPFTPMHHWLGSVSSFEHERERPLLSVLVVGVDSGLPGNGFFTLARDLGHDLDDEKVFADQQTEWCHEIWAPNRKETLMETHRLELPDGRSVRVREYASGVVRVLIDDPPYDQREAFLTRGKTDRAIIQLVPRPMWPVVEAEQPDEERF
jgi:hypothetical protein